MEGIREIRRGMGSPKNTRCKILHVLVHRPYEHQQFFIGGGGGGLTLGQYIIYVWF